jgi:Sulphur oxidation protein SoxZ
MSEDFNVQLRFPRSISQDDIIEIKARIKHPVSTGLSLVETAQTPFERFARQEAAVFIRTVEIYYDDELVSKFSMNSSNSNDPLLAFKLRASKQALVRVVVTDHAGEVVEASQDVVFT